MQRTLWGRISLWVWSGTFEPGGVLLRGLFKLLWTAKDRKCQLPALNLVFLVTQWQLTVFLLRWWEKTAHTGHYFRFLYNLNSKEAQWRMVLANSTRMGGGAGWRQGCRYLHFPEQVKASFGGNAHWRVCDLPPHYNGPLLSVEDTPWGSPVDAQGRA